MSEPMRYEVENDEIQELRVKLGEQMKNLNAARVFCLSSAQRQNVIYAMRELVKRFGEN